MSRRHKGSGETRVLEDTMSRLRRGKTEAKPKQVEVRVSDPKSGGQKGMKVAAYDLVPWDSLEEVAKVYGWGATKYADRNWEKGYKWGLSYAAMVRHMAAFWRREDHDSESGLRHMAHAVWHGLALLSFAMRNIGTDSRGVKCVPDPVPDKVLQDLENAIAKACRENAKKGK